MKIPTDGFAQYFQSPAADDTAPAEAFDPYAESHAVHQIAALNREISVECAKVATLESLIQTLESTETRLSPFQVQMLQHATRNAGGTLAHQQLSMGLEAYQGPLGRHLLTISTESFSDLIKRAVTKIMELFHRLKQWFKGLLNMRAQQARRVMTALNAPSHHTVTLNDMQATAIAYDLSLQGNFAPEKVISNLKIVLDGLTDRRYVEAMKTYAVEVEAILAPMIKQEGNWRTHAVKVNDLAIPVPAGFTTRSNTSEVATYESEPLARGERIVFTATPKGSGGGHADANDGVNGARRRASALMAAGKVGLLSGEDFTGDGKETLQHFSESGVNRYKPDVIAVMKLVVEAETQVTPFFAVMDKQESGLKHLSAPSNDDMPKDVETLTAHLVASIGKATALATALIARATGQALYVGRAFEQMHHAKL